MPKLTAAKAVNPRYDAIKAIVQNRLNDNESDEGTSLRDVMEAQGVEMVDLDTPIEPEIKDSDSHFNQNREVSVDIKADTFTPDENDDIKIEGAPEPEDISLEKDVSEVLEVKPDETLSEEPPKKTEETPVYEKDGKYYTKIKVDGVEEEIEFTKLVASAQKDRASFERFQEAARKEQELAVREDKFSAAQTEKIAQDILPQPVMSETVINDTVNALYDSLAYESEDTVKAELAKIVSGQAQPQSAKGREEVSTQSEPVDIEAQIEAALERKAVQEWESARQAAVAQWEIDYEDISSDPELRAFANERSVSIALANPQQPIQETLKQAGDKARKWRDFEAGKTPTSDLATDINTDERIAKKRAAAAPVRANSAAATREVENDKPLSRSDVVAQIREGRGQSAV